MAYTRGRHGKQSRSGGVKGFHIKEILDRAQESCGTGFESISVPGNVLGVKATVKVHGLSSCPLRAHSPVEEVTVNRSINE